MGIERGDVAALGGGQRETRSRGVGIDQRGFERWVLAPRGEKALGEMGIGRRVRLGLAKAGAGWALGCGGSRLGLAAGLQGSFSLSISNSLIKTENKEKEKGKKRKVRERVGHGDNFPGLAKMRLSQEKWSGQDCKN